MMTLTYCDNNNTNNNNNNNNKCNANMLPGLDIIALI